MEARRFIGKILPDGHLSLPEDTAQNVGKAYEVILFPLDDGETYSYAEQLAKAKGLSRLTEADVERIIHESRGIRNEKRDRYGSVIRSGRVIGSPGTA